ncbi:MAG: DUF11 domain-containing protein, partial [Verrucomicrobia bacterium]|nr:DUF11 domain-containing protein [Verrucomicrobiota bacterium]
AVHNATEPYPVGDTIVTWTVTDSSGNTAQCTQTVTVRDTQPPAVTCPEDLRFVAPAGETNLVVHFPAPAVTDNCSGATAVCVPSSGSLLPLGTTPVRCTAADVAGNSAHCTFTVTVDPGNYPPVANDQSVTTPENTPVLFALTGSDLDGHPLTFALVQGPAHGLIESFDPHTGAIGYMPVPGFIGSDTLTFRVNDGFTNSTAATVTLHVVPLADVAVFKTGSTNGAVGTNLHFTLTVTNRGPSTATNLVVVDQLPASYEFVGAVPEPASVTNHMVIWPAFNLAAHASSNFSITALPTVGGVFTNVGLSTNSTPDPDPGDNDGSDTNSQVTTFVLPLADVVVLKAGPASVPAGGSITYTISVTNRGPSGATNTVVEDALPAGVTLLNASGSPVVDSGVVRWAGVTLPSGAGAIYTLRVRAPLAGILTNIASATSSTPEPVPGNNDGSSPNSRVITVVEPLADVAVFKSGPAEVTPGQTFDYVVTVTNLGPRAAADVLVQDVLPPGVILVNASAGGTVAGQTVTWPAIASLDTGAAARFTLTARAPAAGTFTNVALAGSTTADPDLSNNNGTAVHSQVRTVVVPGGFNVLQDTNRLNPQTGLYEQRVTVTNMGSNTIAAFRLLVGDIRSPSGAPRTNVTLANATGTNAADARPYVQWNAPLDPGSNATVILEFRVPDRLPFTNALEAVAVPPVPAGTNSAAGVRIDRAFLDERFGERRLVIEWTSVPGRTYMVIYSDGNPTGPWLVATPTVTAAANRVQWYDDGPPKTVSKPASGASRFYQVIEVMVNP